MGVSELAENVRTYCNRIAYSCVMNCSVDLMIGEEYRKLLGSYIYKIKEGGCTKQEITQMIAKVEALISQYTTGLIVREMREPFDIIEEIKKIL